MQVKHIILAYMLLWTFACQRNAQFQRDQQFMQISQYTDAQLAKIHLKDGNKDVQKIQIAKEILLQRAVARSIDQATKDIALLSEKQNVEEKSSEDIQNILLYLQKTAQSSMRTLQQLNAFSCLTVLIKDQTYDPQSLFQLLEEPSSIQLDRLIGLSHLSNFNADNQRCQVSAKEDVALLKIAQTHDQLLSAYLQNPILHDLHQAQKVIEHAEIYLDRCLSCEQKIQYQAQICLKDYENALDLLGPISDMRLRTWLDRCQTLDHPITKALMAYRKTMLSPVKEAEWLSEHDALPAFLAFYVRFKIAQRKIIEVIESTEQIEQFVQDETARKQNIQIIQNLMQTYQPQKEKLGNLWDALLIRHDELLIPSLIQSKQQSPKIIRTLARRQAIDYLTNCQKCAHQAKIQEFFEKSAFIISQKWTTASDQAMDFILNEDSLWAFYDHKLHHIKLNALSSNDLVARDLAQEEQQQDLFLLSKDVVSDFPKDFLAPQLINSAGILWMKTDYLIKAFKPDGTLLLSKPIVPKLIVDQQEASKQETCLHFKENVKGMTCIASDGTILMIDRNGKEETDQSFLGQILLLLTPEYAVFSVQNQSKIKVFVFEDQNQFAFDLQHQGQTLKTMIKNHKLLITQSDRLALFDLKTAKIKWQKSILIDDFTFGFQDQNNGYLYILKDHLLTAFNVSDGQKVYETQLNLDHSKSKIPLRKSKNQDHSSIQILDQVNDRLMLKSKNKIYFVDLEGHIRHKIEFKNDQFDYLPFTMNQFMIYEKNGLISIYDVKTQSLSWQSKILPFDHIQVEKSWFVTQYENRLSLYDFTLGKDESAESWDLAKILKQQTTDEATWLSQEKLLMATDDYDACAVSQWQACFRLIETENLLNDLQKKTLLSALCQFAELKACAQMMPVWLQVDREKTDGKSDGQVGQVGQVGQARDIQKGETEQHLPILYRACLFDQSEICLELMSYMLTKPQKNLQEKTDLLLQIAAQKGNLKAQFKLAMLLYQLPKSTTDQKQAIKIYQGLCHDQSYWEACFQLGRIYQQKKSEKALVFFDWACRGGMQEACSILNKK